MRSIQTYTGTGNIDKTTAFGRPFWLTSITIHFSQATSADITIKVNAVGGAAYDSVLETANMASSQDAVYIPDEPLLFENGDEIDIDWTDDTGGAATWGIRVCAELQ